MSFAARSLARLLVLSTLSLGALSAHASLTLLDSISTSVGSISTSLQKSSDSSSGVATAQGPYEVTDVTVAENDPDTLRLTLHALQTGADDLILSLPRQVAEQNLIAVGSVVEAMPREYGLAFALRDTAGAARTFFLVLEDAWYRELDNRRVTL